MPKSNIKKDLINSQNIEKESIHIRVFIIDLVTENISSNEMKERMLELESLVNTYGGIVIVKQIQNRTRPDYNTFIGTGKLEEIINQMQEEKAQLLIIGNILKPRQIYKIDEKLMLIGAKMWDRVDLILKIFEKNARSKESRLQIQLASIKHMGPRIYGMSEELGSQGRGGSKLSRGKGETNTEVMKRHLSEREKSIKEELKNFEKTRKNIEKQGEKKD